MASDKAYWSGVIGYEQQLTGDLRYIDGGALEWDTLPMSLRYTPADNGAHDGAVVVGAICDIQRGEDGQIYAAGFIDKEAAWGAEIIRHLETGTLNGVSMDLDDVLVEAVPHTEFVDKANEEDFVGVMKHARIRGATLVSIPAFEAARIELVREENAKGEHPTDEAVSEYADIDYKELASSFDEKKFSWVGETPLPSLIHTLVEKLELKGHSRSRALSNALNTLHRWSSHGTITAGGEEHVSRETATQAAMNLAQFEVLKTAAQDQTALVAGAAPLKPPTEWFYQPELSGPTALTVTPEGRVYGHLALWGTCHIAHQDSCTQPPQSRTEYAYFHTGALETKDGDLVGVGHITLDTGHASARASAAAAARHYEDTGAVVANVRAGEDVYGIWIAGALLENVDEATRAKLQASPLSGDWRSVQGNLELVAALAVNVPGFPVPRAQGMLLHGETYSLTASGIVPPESDKLSASDRTYFQTMEQQQKSWPSRSPQAKREKVEKLSKTLTQMKLVETTAKKIVVDQMASKLREH